MIHDVDESLRALIQREALNGAKVELTFDAPTKEWASRRNAPAIDVYLYDIREDLERRDVAYEEVRNDEGRVIERRPPPRRFKLSYLITAWTQRAEDEHRLLAALLACFLRYEQLPPDVLAGGLAGADLATLVTVALPPPKDRNLSDVWSALGGELKPSLDLVVTAPFDTTKVAEAGPPVLEEPRISVVSPGGTVETGTAKGGRRKGSARRRRVEPPQPDVPAIPDETVKAGKAEQPGRIIRLRGAPER
jgi:hypothetical protein